MEKDTIRRQRLYQFIIAFTLGIAIIYWIYRDFDFSEVWALLTSGTKWSWMFISLIFGVLSHIIRGLRWQLALLPLGVKPSKNNCVNAIFISYFTNMLIPRIGELSRCGVLKKYSQIPFSTSLGSVVAERFIDTLCILILTSFTVTLQLPLFKSFFYETGYRIPSLNSMAFLYLIVGGILLFTIIGFIVKRFSLLSKVKNVGHNMWLGFSALREMKSKSWLYVLYTVLMWTCYYLHFYLTFYCFSFTSELGFTAGMVLFIVGSIAVIVPTPNGAGPWHFAIITMLLLYGVDETNARIFALIVHTIQSFLVILLGIYGSLALLISNKNQER